MSDLQLFPHPRTLSVSNNAGGPSPTTAPQLVRDPDVEPQGFRIDIGNTITVTSADGAGQRYALALLDQIRAQAEDSLPQLTLADHPDILTRGIMLDISRDRVPTRQTLERYVELLSLARINQFQLYTEHTYAFAGEEEVWRDASPLDADDIRWLDDLCAQHGIELVPNQNTFGHMERFIATPKHQHRAEAPEGWYLGHEHVPSAVLAPTAENARFVHQLLDQVLPLYRSRTVNIGADETFELGQGVSREDVQHRGKGRVYLEYVLRVMTPLLERGYAVQYWADIMLHHPTLLDEMPEGTVPLVWMYEGATSLKAAATSNNVVERPEVEDAAGLEDQLAGFRSAVTNFTDRDMPFWVAPGTSTWRSLLGRTSNAKENILDAARTARDFGGEGILTTIWGDHGMVEPPSVTFPPILFAGAASWNAEQNAEIDIRPVLNALVFEDSTGNIADALYEFGEIWNSLGVPSLNSSPLFDVLMPQIHTISNLSAVDQDAIDRAGQILQKQIARLASATPVSPDGETTVRELTHIGNLALFATNELRRDPGDATERLRKLDALLQEQAACWLLRSRPGGLGHSLGYFNTLRATLAAERGV